MSGRTFRLTKACLADLDSIADFLVTRNQHAARRVVATLLETFEAIAEQPHMGQKRDDLAYGVRVFSPNRPAHNYVICYYERGGIIEISRVFHGAQDWANLIGDSG